MGETGNGETLITSKSRFQTAFHPGGETGRNGRWDLEKWGGNGVSGSLFVTAHESTCIQKGRTVRSDKAMKERKT